MAARAVPLFSEFPTWADLPSLVDTQLMRLEDEMEDGRYVVAPKSPASIRPRT